MEQNTPASKPLALIQPRRAALALMLALAVACGVLAACGVRANYLAGQTAPGGEAQVTIAKSGLTRVALRREKTTPPWTSLALRNGGEAVARGIELWGQGASELIVTRGLWKQPEVPFRPFSLLPEEQFSLTATGGGAQAALLNGLFYWELPQDGRKLKASLSGARRARLEPDGIRFSPGRGEAYVEFRLESPMPLTAARVAWSIPSTQPNPQVWVNTDGDVWGRLPLPRPVTDWLHPVDLTPTVKGRTSFWLRIVYNQEPDESEDEEDAEESPLGKKKRARHAAAGRELTIGKLRIEREVQAPGSLRAWRGGVNELSVTVAAPQNPNLELRLIGTR